MNRIILILCLLIAQYATCQNGYPKRVQIEGEELVLFTPQQARQLDGFRLKLKHSTELVKELQARINDCDNLLEQKNILIKKHKSQLGNYEALSETNTLLIAEKQREISDLNKRLRGSKRTTRILGVGLGVSLVTVGILVIK
nr:MAG TPA: hypothetical protein [Herelleviridae sp.]